MEWVGWMGVGGGLWMGLGMGMGGGVSGWGGGWGGAGGLGVLQPYRGGMAAAQAIVRPGSLQSW